MVGMNNDLGTLEEVIELFDGIDDGVTLQFLYLPVGLGSSEGFRHELDGTELTIDDLKQNPTDAFGGSISVEVDRVIIIQVEVFDSTTNCNF